jgi:hypothetical protein
MCYYKRSCSQLTFNKIKTEDECEERLYRGAYLYIFNNVCEGNLKCDDALRINIKDGYCGANDVNAKSIINPYLLGPMVCAAIPNDDNDPTEPAESEKEVSDDDESWVSREELLLAINSVRMAFP